MSNEDRKTYERLVANFRLPGLPVKRQFAIWRLTVHIDAEAVTQLKRRMMEWIGMCFEDEATPESVADDTEYKILDDI